MKTNHLKSVLLALVCSVSSLATFAQTQIVLDTGHSDLRPGVIGLAGGREFDFNRSMTKLLVPKLEHDGYKVTDVAANMYDPDLYSRAIIAKPSDVFVSIHHDSMQQSWIDAGRRKEFSGFSVFVSHKNANFDASLVCARRIGAQLVKAGEHPSLYHANPIENRPILDKEFGVHAYDNLAVLKVAKSPAVLVEVGVVANPDEEQRLSTDVVKAKIAGAIAEGIEQCVKLGDASGKQ